MRGRPALTPHRAPLPGLFFLSPRDACANQSALLDPSGGGTNPFVSHGFLNALEESGSVCRATGWLPQHLLLREGPSKRLVGAVPLYLKARAARQSSSGSAECYQRSTAQNSSSAAAPC